MGFDYCEGRAKAAAALRWALLAPPALFWSVVFAAVAGVRPARQLLMLEEPDMNTNVNLEAALGVLAFAGSGFVLALLALVAVHALARRRYARARRAALGVAAGAALYAAALLGFSLASGEKVLAGGQEKYFCEVDCHLAYSVAGVRRAKSVGGAGAEATARGEFYVVTVRTRFDPETVSPRRGDAPLTPNPREAAVFDSDGRRYEVSAEGQRALEAAGLAGQPFSTPLRPGEAYETVLVFDLPEGVRDPTLLVSEGGLPTRLIIGHENSLLHRRTRFRLDAAAG